MRRLWHGIFLLFGTLMLGVGLSGLITSDNTSRSTVLMQVFIATLGALTVIKEAVILIRFEIKDYDKEDKNS